HNDRADEVGGDEDLQAELDHSSETAPHALVSWCGPPSGPGAPGDGHDDEPEQEHADTDRLDDADDAVRHLDEHRGVRRGGGEHPHRAPPLGGVGAGSADLRRPPVAVERPGSPSLEACDGSWTTPRPVADTWPCSVVRHGCVTTAAGE